MANASDRPTLHAGAAGKRFHVSGRPAVHLLARTWVPAFLVSATQRESAWDYPAIQEELLWPGKRTIRQILRSMDPVERARMDELQAECFAALTHTASKLTAPQTYRLAREMFPDDFADDDTPNRHVRAYRMAEVCTYLRERRLATLANRQDPSHSKDAKRRFPKLRRGSQPVRHAAPCGECFLPADLCGCRDASPSKGDFASSKTAIDVLLEDA